MKYYVFAILPCPVNVPASQDDSAFSPRRMGSGLVLLIHVCLFLWGFYLALTSASVLAEISVRSPQKLFIFIIQKNLFRIEVSGKICHLILKKEALALIVG